MLLIVYLFACSVPIEAPKDFNALLSYLFEHTMDEDADALIAGANNLLDFVGENETTLRDGYAVNHLSQVALDSTDETLTVSDDTYGVTLQYSVAHSVSDIAYANTAADGMDVYPANYLSYEREHLSDLDCFLNRTCDSFRYRSTILSSLPLGAEMLSGYINELRWIELESGPAFVQRAWMDGEAESSVDWADMTANFYIGLTYSTSSGSDVIAASWAAIHLGDVSLPEDILKNQAIDGLRQNGEDLELWLDENDTN